MSTSFSGAVAGERLLCFYEPRPYLYSFSFVTLFISFQMDHQTMLSLSAPRSTFYEPPPSSTPILADSFELRPAFIAMVQDQSFSGQERENPYHHLREFELLCSCLTIPGVTQSTIKWKLFHFSLIERAKHWYLHNISRMNGKWDRLRDNFCLAFLKHVLVPSDRKFLLSNN